MALGGNRVAQATLRRLEALLESIRREVLLAVQEQGAVELRLLDAALEKDETFTSDGIPVRVRGYGRPWGARKARKGWSMRKLDATGVLRGVLKNPSTKVNRPSGFGFSPVQRNPRVRHYWRHVTSPGGRLRKAPHLLRNLAPEWEKRMEKAIKKKIGLIVRGKLKLAKTILGAAKYDAVVELKLGSFGAGRLV